VHVRSPFAEFRLDAPGRRKAGQPLRLSGFEDARILVHSIHVDEHTDLAPMLSMHEPNYSEGSDVDEAHDRLAHLLTRGPSTRRSKTRSTTASRSSPRGSPSRP
jgi:hypothetical protein